MSTRSLPEPQTKQAKCVEYTVRPGISFYQALRCRFMLDQITYTVGSCSDDIFKHFIITCSQVVRSNKHWKQLHQQKLLHMLEQDCSDVARWYTIETLLAHQVAIPLESDEERQAVRIDSVTNYVKILRENSATAIKTFKGSEIAIDKKNTDCFSCGQLAVTTKSIISSNAIHL